MNLHKLNIKLIKLQTFYNKIVSMNYLFNKIKILFNFIKNFNAKKYLIIGLFNATFGYFSSVYSYILLKSILPDYIIFTFAGFLGITFSYLTLSFFFFNKSLTDLSLTEYSNYVLLSFVNLIFSVVTSTILIRLGINIYITQLISAGLYIFIQLIFNLLFLGKKKVQIK